MHNFESGRQLSIVRGDGMGASVLDQHHVKIGYKPLCDVFRSNPQGHIARASNTVLPGEQLPQCSSHTLASFDGGAGWFGVLWTTCMSGSPHSAMCSTGALTPTLVCG